MGMVSCPHWENRELFLACFRGSRGGFGEGNPVFTRATGGLLIGGPQIIRARTKLTDTCYNSTNFPDREMEDQRAQVT